MNDGEPDYEWDAGFEAGYRAALEEHDSAFRALVEAASRFATIADDVTVGAGEWYMAKESLLRCLAPFARGQHTGGEEANA